MPEIQLKIQTRKLYNKSLKNNTERIHKTNEFQMQFKASQAYTCTTIQKPPF